VIFTVKNVEHLDLSGRLRACGELQIRVVTAAGASQTVGIAIPVRSGQGAVYDLDPLVGQHSTSRAVVSRDRSTKCPDKIDSVATVSAEVPSATPMEALRDFLESDVAADVPRAELPRPFEETYLESDGTFRYEHYLAWSEYVAITVDRMGGGWAVTNWEHGAC
jgi:FAD/FMN-containing dehydrogenase